MVKAVADFNGTSFLLAFDAHYLTSVLARNDIVNAEEYINKIIQLRVSVPLVSEQDMREIADAEFEQLSEGDLTGNFEGDRDRLAWVVHRYFYQLVRSQRDLK